MLSLKDLIRKKRDGETLTEEEVKAFVDAVTAGTLQESQIGAMLMAIWQKGMVTSEVQTLTQQMMLSGEVLSWPDEWRHRVVDKHSTGGVGDKVSLVLAPALAACGCKVPMISGRGLAHTGGTLDKLESIPGYNINQSADTILQILDSVGCCIVGQTEALVPADRVLYALRDATCTVDSLPLIAGSILSKKGAESLSALVLDVKFGRAALYKDLQSAKELAQLLVETGNALGIRTGAALTRMDTMIGRFVGNSLEVMETLETLKGRGPQDLMELTATLGGILLKMANMAANLSEGREQIYRAVQDGTALTKFEAMLKAQGVANQTARSLCSTHSDYFTVFQKSEHQLELKTTEKGTVTDVNGLVLAEVLHQLGAGRSKAGESINHSVGAELLVPVGQRVEEGVSWLRLHHDEPTPTDEQIRRLQDAVCVRADTHTPSLVEELLILQ